MVNSVGGDVCYTCVEKCFCNGFQLLASESINLPEGFLKDNQISKPIVSRLKLTREFNGSLNLMGMDALA